MPARRVAEKRPKARSQGEPCVVGYACDVRGFAPGWRDTRLGGSPVWPPGLQGRSSSVCGLCGRPNVLVIQAYAPTHVHPERVLMVFACNSARCAERSEAWNVLCISSPSASDERAASRSSSCRAEDVHEQPRPSLQSNDISTELPVAGSCPAEDAPSIEREHSGTDSETEMENMLVMLQLRDAQSSARNAQRDTSSDSNERKRRDVEKKSHDDREMSSNGELEGQRSDSGDAQWLRCMSIMVDYDVDEEDVDAEGDSDVKRLLAKYRSSEAERDEAEQQWSPEGEELESEEALALDAFRDCLRRAPGHVVRYERGGLPVWPTYPCPSEPVPCACGGSRIFEMQLMPTCLYYLDCDSATPEASSEAGMNWGTVAVYTCKNDCGQGDSVSLDYDVVDGVAVVHPDDF